MGQIDWTRTLEHLLVDLGSSDVGWAGLCAPALGYGSLGGPFLHFWLYIVCAKLLQSCPSLCNRMDCSPWAPLSMGFFRQEYWSGLSSPSGNLPNPGIEPASLVSPALTGGFFTTGAPGKPSWVYRQSIKWSLKASSSLTLRAVSMIETGHSINYFVVIYKEMPCLL